MENSSIGHLIISAQKKIISKSLAWEEVPGKHSSMESKLFHKMNSKVIQQRCV